MWRRALLAGAVVVLGGFGFVAWYVRTHVVPPDCRDPRTLALVRESLLGRFHLPPTTRMSRIDMQAGGWLAFRFICVADLEIPEKDLPPGPRPGYVHYTSELADSGRRQEVTVSISPLLQWVLVQ
jgi:hypothetical protein